MKMNNKIDILQRLKGSISPYDAYCNGFGSPGATGYNYLLGIVLGVGRAKIELSGNGSDNLDQINAFDKAEVYDTNIGQINMINVSSFCGLNGLVWGYDIAKHYNLRHESAYGVSSVRRNGKVVRVYSGEPLVNATKRLFGTVNKKRFPLIPGSHVPCAGKNIKLKGPIRLYSAIAIGIASDRTQNANLLMEDMGFIPDGEHPMKYNVELYEPISRKIATSILMVGENQHVEYKEIFVVVKDVFVHKDEIGCALVAAPYFTLAKNAIPENDLSLFSTANLQEWEHMVSSRFLCDNVKNYK